MSIFRILDADKPFAHKKEKYNPKHFVTSIFIIALARIGCNGFVPSYESYVINGKSGGYHGL